MNVEVFSIINNIHFELSMYGNNALDLSTDPTGTTRRKCTPDIGVVTNGAGFRCLVWHFRQAFQKTVEGPS